MGIVPIEERNVPVLYDVGVSEVNYATDAPVEFVPSVEKVREYSTTYRADVARQYSVRREWKALQGYDLKDILYSWSGRAGVHLVWDTAGNFSTREPLRSETTYQSAVQMLLDQYGDSSHRPVGSIYMDPETAERYLVIRTAG